MHEQILGQFAVENLYIQQVFEHYRQCYLANTHIQEFVATSTRIDEEHKQHSYIGLCDRTLGLQIPSNKTQQGSLIRGHLLRAGLLIASGGERFRGCVLFAEPNAQGHIESVVGYRYGRVRAWQSPIIYWHKPEAEQYVSDGLNALKELAYAKANH